MFLKSRLDLSAAYVIGLSIIAFMSITAYAVTTHIIQKNQSTATLINISGQQRMLSQRIALYANELVIVPKNERPTVRAELEKMLYTFEDNHSDLIEGDAERGLGPLRSETVRRIYFDAPDNLDHKVKEYVELVGKILLADDQDLTFDNPDLYKIDHVNAIELLTLLNRVVHTHERESNMAVRELQQIKTVILAVILSIILIEGFFLFRPLVRSVKEKTKRLEQQALKLEEQAAELFIAREEADDARLKSEEATKLKSEFLANMSHEIRTPMNGIIGMLNLLIETKLTPDQNRYAEVAVNSADTLLTLINDILDFSKIEAGKLEFEIIPFNLHFLIEEAMELITIKAQEKDLEMLLKFDADLPVHLMGDPGRIRQIVLNLASNAIKFTEEGHILVGIETMEEDDTHVTFKAYVEDTGIGIPHAKQEHIFQKFNQADGSTTRKFGGTGLGLAISKELASRMEGQMGLESIPGVGSKFWFTFRLEKDTNAEHTGPLNLSADLTDVRALIVDDNKTAQDIAADPMLKAGMNVAVCGSPYDALHMMRQAVESGKPYEMAVLDYMMPGMNGIELGEAIKEDEGLQDTALLMISSAPNNDDQARMKEIGFKGYLSKPAAAQDIIQALSAIQSMRLADDGSNGDETMITRHMLREARTGKKQQEEGLMSFPDAQILLAEDNPNNQMVATTMLEKMGCHVTPAGNGQEAVRLMKQQQFDLIFMDCNMPEMDGFEATKVIRQLEEHNHSTKTPIIAFTAYAMQGDDQRCYDAGMDDYITKPVKKAAMIHVLNKWLQQQKEAA